eukprot:1457654-Pleurochrysis_carterae.AAC.1
MSGYLGESGVNGTVLIEPVSAVGVLAYTAQSTIVNTAVLSGDSLESQVLPVEFYNRAETPSEPLAPPYECSSSDPLIARVAGLCLVVVDADTERGGAVNVSINRVGASVRAIVSIYVWFPIVITVGVNDPELNTISDLRANAD